VGLQNPDCSHRKICMQRIFLFACLKTDEQKSSFARLDSRGRLSPGDDKLSHIKRILKMRMRDGRKIWGGKRESNPQPSEPQSGALPVELFPPPYSL
jgi:hypothetical protein